jgi:hypothetical protein
MPFVIEPSHIQEAQIRAAATAGAEDPGSDSERLDIV